MKLFMECGMKNITFSLNQLQKLYLFSFVMDLLSLQAFQYLSIPLHYFFDEERKLSIDINVLKFQNYRT